MRVDDLEEALGGDVGLRRLGIVLVDYRNLLAQPRDHVGEVSDDLCFRLQAGERGDHDAAGTGIPRNLAELDEVCRARVRHPDDNGHAAVGAAQEMARELSRLLIAELLRFAHHPENRQALHATLQIEFDQAIDARPINVTGIGERRGRDRVNALGGRIEQLAHGSDFLESRFFAENVVRTNLYLARATGQPMQRRLHRH
jgi:hypothetical protein